MGSHHLGKHLVTKIRNVALKTKYEWRARQRRLTVERVFHIVIIVFVEIIMTAPISFPFPFEPYDIQKSFMHELYKTLMEGKLGIFESPTGTVSVFSIYL